MSTTIYIRNDKDESIVEEYECCDNPDCIECHGTGKITFKNSAWEMNLSWFNFPTLWEQLGLKSDNDGGTFGEISAAELLDRIQNKQVSLAYQKYLPHLSAIAKEAKRRNEVVCWG